MAEPDNHTLRLLREMRAVLEGMSTKMDRNHDELKERIEKLRQAAFGESVLGRYAVAEVEERLSDIEKRLTALEEIR